MTINYAQNLLFGIPLLVWVLSAVSPNEKASERKLPAKTDRTPHALGDFRNDTLLLTATYAECGEFGGHREVIKVYMRAEEQRQARRSGDWAAVPLTATWFLDTAHCARPNRKFFLAGQQQIDRNDEAVILEYIQNLLTRNLQERGLTISNGGNRYVVRRARERQLHVEYYDPQNAWNGFESLRQQLFKRK